jgi:hypothetical protein
VDIGVKHTLSHLACFIHHLWTSVLGYDDSTIKRLKNSFYFEKAQLPDKSTWDPKTLAATSYFSIKADTWLQENAHYDPLYRGATSTTANSPATDVTYIADTVRKSLRHNLQY